jgi:hypothetical protein
MEVVGLHGRDGLGLLGRREVFALDPLFDDAVDRLFRSFDLEHPGGAAKAPLRKAKRRFAPRAAAQFREDTLLAGDPVRVAVLPFRIDGTARDAGIVLEHLFLRHLTRVAGVHVIDPGVVREALLRARIVMFEGPSLDQADIIGSLTSADLEITGSVRTYVAATGAMSVPFIEFWTFGLEPDERTFVWSSFSSNRGDDGVLFFQVGRISSPEQLAFEMTQSIVQRWTATP